MSTQPSLQLTTYPPDQQGRGAFDNGRITERKPVGMPQDSSARKGVGPLFYWAWARAESHGKIALHPHRGFEIISYVLAGQLAHRDTLGTRRQIGRGGLQAMQTGSGISHEEVTEGEPTEFFQIWFQPELNSALTREPVYADVPDAEFFVHHEGGVRVKTVLGPGSPVALVSDVSMEDLEISPQAAYTRRLAAERSWLAVATQGTGRWSADAQQVAVQAGDLSVLQASSETEVTLESTGTVPLRIVIVEVPTTVSYPLVA